MTRLGRISISNNWGKQIFIIVGKKPIWQKIIAFLQAQGGVYVTNELCSHYLSFLRNKANNIREREYVMLHVNVAKTYL